MFELKRKIDGLSWIIQPPRLRFDVLTAKADIENEFISTGLGLVCPYVDGDAVLASFSFSASNENNYWDFGLKFRLEHGLSDNVVYIEPQGFREGFEDQFLVVVLDKGELVIDVLCGIDEIYSEVTAFVQDLSDFKFKIYDLDEAFLEKTGFDLSSAAVTNVKKPLTEQYLLKDDCLFVKNNEVQARLKPKGIYLRWIAPLLIILSAIGFLFYEPTPDKSSEVVYETIDPEKDYKEFMLGKVPQASNRLAQDYNNHLIIEETARGWEVSRVLHTNEHNVIYEVRNDSGSLRELRAIVEIVSRNTSVPAVLDLTETGNVVIFQGLNIPIYTENTIAVWNVREAYEFFSDAITLLIPNIDVNFTGFQGRGADSFWKSMNLSLDFQQMPISQLMVLSKITKNMPISIVNGNYVNTNGLLTGNIQIQIHGEE